MAALPSVEFVKLSSNKTPHFEAHQNIFVSLLAQPCSNVHAVLDDERCIFVTETKECHESSHYVDYMHLMYCVVDSSNVVLFSSMIIALLVLVLTIGAIIHHLCVNRYVDAILYVAKSWQLNEYIAGVTLLSYGNGLAQVLSVLKHHKSGDTELLYNMYLGSAVYQASFLAALVIWMRRFYIYPEVILPNLATLAVISVYVKQFEYVGILENVILGVLYAAFLGGLYTIGLVLDRPGNRSRSQIEIRDTDGKLFDIKLTEHVPTAENGSNTTRDEGIWHGLRTFCGDDYRNARWCRKCYLLCSIPVVAITTLLLPKVNYEQKLHGWNKWIFALNLNLFPLFVIYTALVDVQPPIRVGWICCGSLVATAILSIVMCLSTKDDQKPPFFSCVGLFTVFGTSYVIMLLTYEMIAILETLSIIANISPATFAITVVSWGSCWNDLVTLIILARRGYPRLAFAACLGAPVFNILIGLCTVFVVQMVWTGSTSIHVRDGTSGPTSSAYLFMIPLTQILLVLFTRFRARASLALCLSVLYTTFIVYIVFCEMEITHGYGTDHNDDGEYFQDRIPQHGR